MIITPTKEFVIKELDKIGCFEIREDIITLKSGKKSNFYADLRKTFGYPSILKSIARLVTNDITTVYSNEIDSTTFQKETCICGLPYAALPLATVISQLTGLGQIVLRKEAKKHGTKKLIEGLKDDYKRVIIVDDVMTSGISILEGISALKDHFTALDVFVVLNRGEDLNQEFKSTLKEFGARFSWVFSLNDLPFKYLESINPKASYETLERHLKRYKNSHSTIQQLFKIACEKQSNLIVSIDNSDPETVIHIIQQVAESVVCVKLHYDILNLNEKRWNNFFNHLNGLKRKYNFLIFEDRKFMDIGNTVYMQYSRVQEIYGDDLDITNACLTSGPQIVDSIREYHA